MLELFAWGEAGWGDELARGLGVTVALAIVTLPFGLLLGFLVAGAALSPKAWLRWVGTVYTTLMRGLPELLTLFVVCNGVGLLINAILARLPPRAPASSFHPSSRACWRWALSSAPSPERSCAEPSSH